MPYSPAPDHADVHATWRIYQDLLAAYRDRDPRRGKNTLRHLITTLTRPGLPHTCIELARMGRTLTRRAGDILAYFDHPHTSNGPTEAINGRLEHLRGIAQGFVNHRNYRLRCLLHSGGFQHLLHPQMRRVCYPCDTTGKTVTYAARSVTMPVAKPAVDPPLIWRRR